MKFQLEYDDIDYGRSTPTKSPCPQAYEETYWLKETKDFNGSYRIRLVAKVKVEDGIPFIAKEVEQVKPDKAWFSEGRNHKEALPNVWEREVERTRWCIEINTLEEFLFFYGRNGFDLYVGGDELPTIIV